MHTYTKIVIAKFIIYMKFDRLQEEFDSNWRIMGRKIRENKIILYQQGEGKAEHFSC